MLILEAYLPHEHPWSFLDSQRPCGCGGELWQLCSPMSEWCVVLHPAAWTWTCPHMPVRACHLVPHYAVGSAVWKLAQCASLLPYCSSPLAGACHKIPNSERRDSRTLGPQEGLTAPETARGRDPLCPKRLLPNRSPFLPSPSGCCSCVSGASCTVSPMLTMCQHRALRWLDEALQLKYPFHI